MSVKCILAQQGGKGSGTSGGSGVILKNLEITKYPLKTVYINGDSFDSTGLELTASYGIEQSATIIATAVIPINNCVISPSILTDTTEYIKISYSENGVTVSTRISVTVNPSLTGLNISGPNKTNYEWGDAFSTNGLLVTAQYSNETSKTITDYTMKIGSINLTNNLALSNSSFVIGTNTVTTSFTEEGRAVTEDFDITISEKKLTIPSQSGTLTYNGSNQSPTLSNFDNSLMSVTDNSQVNAGNYTAVVSLKDTAHYKWSDNTKENKNVSQSINKAAGSISLSKTNVEINANNLSQTITITRAGNGAISYSPTSVTGLTLSLSGNVLTVEGDGSTVITNQVITINVAEGTNHTVPTNKTFTINTSYWSWGDETAVGDATWWAGLKSALPNMTTTERANLVGKKKKVTLTTAIAGWNNGASVSVICIGSDIDADNSLTFQTEGSSPEQAAFSSSNALWASSTARTTVTTFANNCSATDSILSVTKLTSSLCNSRKSNTPDIETKDKGFVPSEVEMGLGNSYSSSNLEGTKDRVVKAYPYYNSNSKRIKYACSANGDITTKINSYWERSRYFVSSYADSVCFVANAGTPIYDTYWTSYVCLAPAFVIG